MKRNASPHTQGPSFAATLAALVAAPPPLCAHCDGVGPTVYFGGVVFHSECFQALDWEFARLQDGIAQANARLEAQRVPW